MSDILTAPRLTLRAVARLCDVHIATVHRWRQRGIKGARLPTIRIGGRVYVLASDLDQFLARCSDRTAPAREDRDDYDRRADEANARAEAMGL